MRTLKVIKSTANTISLTWKKPVDNGGSAHLDYVVTYSKIKMETTKVAKHFIKQVFITLDRLEPSTKYNIAVKAKNPGGESIPAITNATTDIMRKVAFPFSGFVKSFS